MAGKFTVDPAVRSGKPCIRDTRITPVDMLEYMAGGMTLDELVDDFPELSRDDLLACLAFGVEAARREQEIIKQAAGWPAPPRWEPAAANTDGVAGRVHEAEAAAT